MMGLCRRGLAMGIFSLFGTGLGRFQRATRGGGVFHCATQKVGS